MLSERENALNFYRHKPMDHFTTYFDAIQFIAVNTVGFREYGPPSAAGYDWFGVYWIYDEAQFASIPDPKQKYVLEDICDWREVIKWPDLDAIDWKEAAHIDGADEMDKEESVYMQMLGNGPFERLHTLMGFEGALCALASEPEECKAFFEKWTEWRCKLIHYICEYYKPDVIQVHDDSGTQISTFYSPATWRELIKPCWIAMCNEIKKHGVFAELHTCGKNEVFLNEMANSGFDSYFVQSLNDFQYIRKFTEGRVGYSPTDFSVQMEMKALAGGITVKEVRDTVYNFVKKNIEGSPNGYDFMMLVFPGPEVEDATEDTLLTQPTEVCGCAWEWVHTKAPEFTEMLQKKNAENLSNSLNNIL